MLFCLGLATINYYYVYTNHHYMRLSGAFSLDPCKTSTMNNIMATFTLHFIHDYAAQPAQLHTGVDTVQKHTSTYSAALILLVLHQTVLVSCTHFNHACSTILMHIPFVGRAITCRLKGNIEYMYVFKYSLCCFMHALSHGSVLHVCT